MQLKVVRVWLAGKGGILCHPHTWEQTRHTPYLSTHRHVLTHWDCQLLSRRYIQREICIFNPPLNLLSEKPILIKKYSLHIFLSPILKDNIRNSRCHRPQLLYSLDLSVYETGMSFGNCCLSATQLTPEHKWLARVPNSFIMFIVFFGPGKSWHFSWGDFTPWASWSQAPGWDLPSEHHHNLFLLVVMKCLG